MIMKIEKGMYVRFNYHRVTVPIQIAQIIEVYYDEAENCYYYTTDVGLVISNNNLIGEPSFNPIKLIKVGDYVNGELVEDITGEYLRVNGQSHNKHYFSKQIKSIVTKEQFEQMSYKIGE